MEIESIKPFIAVMIPLIGSVAIILARKKQNLRDGCTLVTSFLMLFAVLTMISPILEGNTLHYVVWGFWPSVPIGFRVDGLGLIFGLVASVTWVLTSFYSIGYMRSLNERSQTRFYYCFAVTLFATLGAAFSNNWFTLFLFYELITFFTYPLVAHHETEDAWEKGNKYLAYLLGTSKVFLIPAILGVYYFAGSVDFTANGIIPPEADKALLVGIYICFLAGIGKVAFMPLHSWLPASMVAPTPVSALLHAVAVVNTGAFCVLRVIINIFGIDLVRLLHIGSWSLGEITAVIASITIIMASIYCMRADNLKERIAYSTVSQLSYMVLGGALLTPSGLSGGIMHIAMHAFAKITLFFCAGSIYVATKKTHVSQMHGIARKMPWTMAAFALATLSMVGIPPAGGFVSKWYLMVGATEAKEFWALMVLATSALLNAFYFVPIVMNSFFRHQEDEGKGDDVLVPQSGPVLMPQSVGAAAADIQKETKMFDIQESPLFVVVPLCITAVVSLLLGIFPEVVLQFVGVMLQ
ncbi:MAG: monovalent cation/H+ antiporter subunit D family protein [Nitrospira sp.]|nr:monovalent cation/H+ antiporter subunit D family protein [Candidatus Manganitrophaceae bacterium]HIL34045.1 monovalent cation/H+ antiporter subunit D family protein [Candidatus Manganitrophaceae bacterium]